MQCLIKEVFSYVNEVLIRQKAVKEGVIAAWLPNRPRKILLLPA